MNRLKYLFLALCLICSAALAEVVDFTFAIWSDTHFRDDGGAYRDNCAQDIVLLPGTPYPSQIGGTVGPIRFVLVTGDITENSYFKQYQDNDGQTNDDFISCINYWFTPWGIPIYEVTGNHDSYNEPGLTQIRQAIAGRHGSTSYSLDYSGVHFIGLDGWSSGTEPFHASALSYLEAHMPTLNTEQAVIIFNHYTPQDPPHAQWDRVYNAIKAYNVILMCQGHEHYPRVGQWRGFDYFVTSDCRVVHGNQAFTVVRITDTELTAVARDWYNNTWRTDALIRKPITGLGPWFSPYVVNPGFEDNGGSLDGWQVFRTSGKEGPDTPPLDNSNAYGVRTPFGNHFAGKITSWMQMDFTLGQIIEVSDYAPCATEVDWELSAYVQLHSRTGTAPYPGNVHQVWEIGWNNDGSAPANVNQCQVYRTVANIDATFTGNDPKNFYPLSARGTISGVPGLRYVAFRVRMYNDAGREWSMSNVDNVSFTLTTRDSFMIGQAKRSPDGSAVSLCAKTVTAVLGDAFYVEQADRSAGIRVVKPGHGMSPDMKVAVTGNMQTNADGERYVSATDVAQYGSETVAPLFMVNRELGGANWEYNAGTGAGQKGVTGASGLNDIGLLVTTCGGVKRIGNGCLYIDDGSNLLDGTLTGEEENVGVRVICDPAGYESGDYLVVTGISSCFETPSGQIARRILTRKPEDVRKLGGP